MALAANEIFDRGFVRRTTDGALMVTYSATSPVFSEGFLRDADGRLVMKRG